MVDFVKISTRINKGITEIYPKFLIKRSNDLMIRGSDFYAIWMEDRGLWSTDEQDVVLTIDRLLDEYAEKKRRDNDGPIHVKYMWDAESGMIDKWHKYVQRQSRDNFHMLDEVLTFSNTEVKKTDYVSKRLPYALEPCDISSYDRLISVLYEPEERHKIEWAIGSIICGDSKWIQKFLVFYGAMGTGKSTVLNIIQKLFEGYYSVFDARALGSASNSFALEAFRSNPLVAIQHDGDLSHIEDNTRLNSLVSHELMTVNEKFKSTYANNFKCFLFMGTNKPVKITDAKSGLIRRLIDVSPSGNKIPRKEYEQLVKKIDFELGGIACHCLAVYQNDPAAYDDYIPLSMMGASNDFFNFVLDSYSVFKDADGTSLKIAWEMYKTYVEYAKIPYSISQRVFREELKNYFEEYYDRYTLDDGTRVRSYYKGFRRDRIEDGRAINHPREVYEGTSPSSTGDLLWGRAFSSCSENLLETELSSCPAQYTTDEGTPVSKWSTVTTSLSDIITEQLHYVKPPENMVVIDFDWNDFAQNIKAAEKWPQTYAELSRSGHRIHLHYYYSGDIKKLEKLYAPNIEIKTFGGKSALRRKRSKWINLPIATLNSGLPIKKEVNKPMNAESLKSEQSIRNMVIRNLKKEIHPDTTSSVDFIKKILDDAYDSGVHYDITDMQNTITAFAAGSTHQANKCLSTVASMKFKSKEPSAQNEEMNKKDVLTFFDVEVFPNLFVVCWKHDGSKDTVGWINPTPEQIMELSNLKIVGFNNRDYDNHILYGRILGYDNEQLYKLSQAIIAGERVKFGEAFNLSYTDVYDFSSAGNKKSLKKLEIEMGIHHQELGLPWDQPVDKDLWPKVVEYCINDVEATEAAFHYLKGDWTARQILADLAEMTVNDTTNSLTTRIIFGKNKTPQNEFLYRDLSQPVKEIRADVREFLEMTCPEMMRKRHNEWQLQDFDEDGISYLPFFPGYTYDFPKEGNVNKKISTYRGEVVGEGGYVYAEPGIHCDVALLDIASMHPHSCIAECLLGPRYTKRFWEIVEARVAIKHEDWDSVRKMLNGQLSPYVDKILAGEMKPKDLANGLKTPINSFYGISYASFPNPAKDPRNVDNIIAKRGALFMINLKHEVQAKGFRVAHIKTDSIKIPNATPEIIQFVMDYGKEHGYTFEHEATYDRMCLVNDAVYIAKYKDTGKWTATGTQFAVPYVFKKLFSHEDITFEDMCETKSVKSAIYLDMNEALPEGEHKYVFVGRIGQFCPMKKGVGAGELLRVQNDKYYAVTGTKGYRWMESEQVKALGLESCIDTSYYEKLVEDASLAIEQYMTPNGLKWFLSDEPYERSKLENEWLLPF